MAERLAEAAGADFRYANLAVRGRRLPQIVAEQVPAAVAMSPSLVTLAGGTNDALRRHFDPAGLAAVLRSAVRQLTRADCRVVLFTGTDPTRRLPAARRLVPRVAALNDASRTIAAEFDCLLVDLWPAAEIFDAPAMWSEDRLHLSGEGHRRVAGAVLETLGVACGYDWRAAAAPVPAPPWRSARASDLRWLRSHLGPWLHRRVTGRSSGDTVGPKRPSLQPYG